MPRKGEQRRASESDALNDFRRIIRSLRVSAQRAQNVAGISAAQLYVLAQLAEGSAMSINDLGARTFTDRSSAGAVVRRLVERGLVARARAVEDRRYAEVRITARGLQALKHAPDPPTHLLVSGLEALDESSLAALVTGLRALVAEMGLADAHPALLFDDEGRKAGRPTRPATG